MISPTTMTPAVVTVAPAMTAASAAPATNYWASFSSSCSAAIQKMAAVAAKIWAAIKGAAMSMYNAALPYISKAVVWCQANPMAVAIGLGSVAAAGLAYYCFCRSTGTPAPAAQAQAQGAPAAQAAAGTPPVATAQVRV